MDISSIRKAVLREQYEISHHAEQERRNDNLFIEDIEAAILNGEIIESYPDDPRGPSCLVCGRSKTGRPVHVVVGFLSGGWCRIITVYVPNPDYWENDWKTRRRKDQ